jgi:oxygen-independent coproporphyrinogen-3 oxidase
VRARHLYVHVPFCARRCVYCDFAIAVRPRIPVDEYLQALDQELTMRHATSELNLATLYIGGGTPSKLGGDGIARLLEATARMLTVSADAEITIEANPEDVSTETVRTWRGAGINRVSLGVQSFDDGVLRWMHRTHDADTARNAVQVLREGGIDNISIDLIFATPATVPRSWSQDLDETLALELPHVSVYGLTVEERTPLGRWVARRDVTEAADEIFEREFLLADASLRADGFEHYEVSNFSQPGRRSRHNSAYWRRSPYAGLGPSAHEFDGDRRRWNAEAYTQWVAGLTRGEDPLAGCEDLGEPEVLAEMVYLSMRTSDGLALTETEIEHVAPWVESGWARIGNDSRLCLTALGWLRLDSLASDLTLLRSRC